MFVVSNHQQTAEGDCLLCQNSMNAGERKKTLFSEKILKKLHTIDE
jgi:hypothetical protein